MSCAVRWMHCNAGPAVRSATPSRTFWMCSLAGPARTAMIGGSHQRQMMAHSRRVDNSERRPSDDGHTGQLTMVASFLLPASATAPASHDPRSLAKNTTTPA
jgi:hypothetical protein